MAGEMKNLAGLFTNTKTRVVIFFTLFVVLVIAVVVYFMLHGRFGSTASNANVANVPGSIQSIPGSFNPTPQYARLQEKQNALLAKQALSRGTSAVPTMIRSSSVNGNQGTNGGGAGFAGLQREQQGGGGTKLLAIGTVKSEKCNVDSLQKAKATGATLQDLKDAGCSATQLKGAGFDASDLRSVGFSACDLKEAGLSAQQLADAGFPPDELKGAGFSPSEVQLAREQVAGLPFGITAAKLIAANCSAEVLKNARQSGVTAQTLRRITGCSAAALRAAGYSAQQLRNAGYSAAELRNTGFTPKELKDAGFTARELREASVAPNELQEAGFAPNEIAAAEKNTLNLPTGISIADLKKAGCSQTALEAERKKGVSAAMIKKVVGCSAAELLAAGYTPAQLRAAGFSAGELRRAGLSAQQLKDAGFTAKELKDAGFSAADLKAAGFNAQQLKDAGFSAAQLRAAGFTPQQLKDAGYTAGELKAAGMGAKELLDAGFTPEQLTKAGFTTNALKALGLNPTELNTMSTPGAPSPGGGTFPSVGGGNNAANASLQQLLQRQAVQASAQQNAQRMGELKNNMQGQAQQLFAQWQSAPKQQYVAGRAKTEENSRGHNRNGSQKDDRGSNEYNGRNENGNESTNSRDYVYLKTGDITFAVTNTAINSDERGPVLATIVQGQLKGGKLIGTFALTTRYSQKLVLQFKQLSLPYLNKTVGINAVAIDPKTARTALANSVDNHYIQRYGLRFAGAFLKGFGQAVSASGSTTQKFSDGSTQINNPTLTKQQKEQVAWGAVGDKIDTLFQDSSRPPTVQIYSGVGMGILFMSDARIPSPQSQQAQQTQE